MRIVLELIQEMVVVLVIVQILAAFWALPVWGVLLILQPEAVYWDALAVTFTVAVGVCILTWVSEITKGVSI